MWKTVLKDTIVNGNRVVFDYDYPEEWNQFMVNSEERLFAEYEFSLEDIPKSILNIQFVANAMLLNMFHDGIVEVDELDSDFYHSIPNILNGYRELYPSRNISISVRCKKLIDNVYTPSQKRVAAFTGGVDATSAVASHISEELILANIWGGDIKLDNTVRHDAHVAYFKKFAERYKFGFSSIQSNFRFIYNDQYIPDKFENDWWAAVGHSVLIPAVIAPLIYHHKASRLYLASSYPITEYDEKKLNSANYIRIVDAIRLGKCMVEQCDPTMTRSAKIQNIASVLQPEKEREISLLACWNHGQGSVVNCCKCEKCYRTIMDIKSCHEDPRLYGFDVKDSTYQDIETMVKSSDSLPEGMWKDIQAHFRSDRRYWKNDPQIKWILTVKINKPYVNLYPWWKRAYWKCREIGGKTKRAILNKR